MKEWFLPAIFIPLVWGFWGLFPKFAVSKGKVSIVVLISALYPVVTIALSYFFLNETISLKEGIGMVFALTAIILFTT